MRSVLMMISILFVFGLVGCGTATSNEGEANVNGTSDDSKQVEDFKVSIHVEEDRNVYATITYVGEAAEKEIYHGGSIFFFNVYQQDGKFKYETNMTQPLITTTLMRNEPHKVKFNGMENLKLKKGTYKFEAIADFFLDTDDAVGTSLEIPVSKIAEVK